MNEDEFEGTLILEKLAEIDRLDEFYEALDSDHLDRARSLMIAAQVDSESIAWVLKKMKDSDGQH